MSDRNRDPDTINARVEQQLSLLASARESSEWDDALRRAQMAVETKACTPEEARMRYLDPILLRRGKDLLLLKKFHNSREAQDMSVAWLVNDLAVKVEEDHLANMKKQAAEF